MAGIPTLNYIYICLFGLFTFSSLESLKLLESFKFVRIPCICKNPLNSLESISILAQDHGTNSFCSCFDEIMSYIAKIKSFKNTRKYEYMSMRFGEVVNFSMIFSKITHNGGGGKQIECT